jgi:hypothetical protein
MMTALSVAKDCQLIRQRERTILVSVSPPSDGCETGTIEWKEVETKYAQTMNSSTYDLLNSQVK